jgi:hypothetical protein
MMGTVFAQVSVTFNVDMTADSTFDPATQHVYISGDFAGWAQPGTNADYMLIPDENNEIYTITVADVPAGKIQYKYFIVEDTPTWDMGEWGGDPNRMAIVVEDVTIDNVWGNKPSVVTFNVDMSTDSTFNPPSDQVYIAGDLANGWAQPGTIPCYALTDAGDNIYTITLNLYNGDYQYKYFIVTDSVPSWSGGEWDGDPNRTVTISCDTVIDNVWSLLNTGIPAVELPQFSMYPNPVVNNLYIDNIENANRIEVYNLVGQKVKEVNVSGTKVAIETSDLTKGVYLISVINENGAVKSLKFMKK